MPYTVNNLFSLKLLNKIDPIFTASDLQNVDQSSTLVSEVLVTAQSAVKSITVSKTTSADELAESYFYNWSGLGFSEKNS